MQIFKKINKSGGIVFPRRLRTEAGYLPGTAVSMELKDDSIVIKKHIPVCFLCGNAEDTVTYKKLTLCRSCHEDFGKGFEADV